MEDKLENGSVSADRADENTAQEEKTSLTQTDKAANNALFGRVSELLHQARTQVLRSINTTMVYTYYEIGRMIVEDEQDGENRAEYGAQVLKDLSERLTKEFEKGFSVDNLERMKKFYLLYSTQITVRDDIGKYETLSRKSISLKSQTVSGELQNANEDTAPQTELAEFAQIYETLSRKLQRPDFKLSWSHYLKLIRIADVDERRFYEIEAFANNWSLRELQRQCDSALYQRLVLSRDKKAVKELSVKGQIIEKPEDTLKDPYILEFTGLPEHAAYSENQLEQKLIDKIECFLLELGKGFTFVGRQVRFTFDEDHFRVDLVFYNRLLQCFVLIDLKIGKLKHQDLGQMQMYVNYYDRYVKLEHENKTVGVILCQDKSETLVKITLPEDNKQIFASRYQTVLPSKEEFQHLIEVND